MNVFDEEMGPLLPQEEAEMLIMLLESRLTLEEYRAWVKLTGKEKVN